MKIFKYILLALFGLTLLGVMSNTLFPFKGGDELLNWGVLITVVLIPIYGIVALIKKQHRMEAAMMLVSIQLILGGLFQISHWPFSGEVYMYGSFLAFPFAIGILMVSIGMKTKIAESILFVIVGFCSIAYLFKAFFWPYSTAMVIAAFLTMAFALFIILKSKSEFTASKGVLGILLLLLGYCLVTKESKLFQISSIDPSGMEANLPQDYYRYAWILKQEGDTQKAKTNLQYAINELNNPDNKYAANIAEDPTNYLEVYEAAINSLNNNQWDTFEWPGQASGN